MRTAGLLIVFSWFLAAAFGCSGGSAPKISVTELSAERPGPVVSLMDGGASLYAVFSQLEAQSIAIMEIPVPESGSPPDAGRVVFMDRIDTGPAPSPGFGEFACAMSGPVPWVLYLDSASDDVKVLKLLSRPKSDWVVDVLEPAGLPVALYPVLGQKQPLAFWASSGRLLQGGGTPRTEIEPFSPSGLASQASGGIMVYDLSSEKLLFVRPESYGTIVRSIPGGSPIHTSAPRSDGALAAAVWEPATRRIMLLEEQADGSGLKSTLVTQSTDTRCLSLAQYGTGYLFLYDTVERSGARILCLLHPEGTGYDRIVLQSSNEPFASTSMRVRGRVAYVLAAGKTLELISIPF